MSFSLTLTFPRWSLWGSVALGGSLVELWGKDSAFLLLLSPLGAMPPQRGAFM